MKNEEKILQILTKMQVDISSLQEDVSELKQGQGRLEREVRTVKDIVLRMENEHGTKIKALFDGYSVNYDKTSRLEPKVKNLEDTVERHTLQLDYLNAAK